PTLTNGNYFSETDGSGTAFSAGDLISSSQTIFIYNQVGTPPNSCANESSFNVTILSAPEVDSLPNQIECASFTLPSLSPGNNYYNGSLLDTTTTPVLLNEGD
ncbi:hypothetical protein, partial [Lacinutrix salivirga]